MEKTLPDTLRFGDPASALNLTTHAGDAESFNILHAPVTKLDADQYMAEDLDGVTESLFGSGNLNFLLMQAGQTNDLMALSSPFTVTGETPASSGGLSSGAFFASSLVDSGSDFNFGHNDLSTDRLVADYSPHEDLTVGGGHGFTSSTLNSLGASSLVANAPLPLNAINGFDGNPGDQGGGENGLNGSTGADGAPGTGTTIIEVDNSTGDVVINPGDITIDLGDITLIDPADISNLLTTVLNTITNTTGDITNVVDNIVNNLLDGNGGLILQLDTLLSDATGLNLDVLTGDTVTNLVNQGIDLTPATGIVDSLLGPTDLGLADLHSVISILNGNVDHSPGDTDLGLGLTTGLGDISPLNAVFDTALNPVEDIVGDIDILADLGLNPLHADSGANDTDLNLGLEGSFITGNLIDLGDGLNIGLDPVENLIGDIDINGGAGIDLLDQASNGLIDEFSGGTGENNSITDLGNVIGDNVGSLVSSGNTGDHDLGLGLDTGIGGVDLSNETANVILDPVEDLAGDIDIFGDIGFDPFNVDQGTGDTDLSLGLDGNLLGNDLAGLPGDGVDINLDPLENIIGDTDLDLGVATHVLGDTADGFSDTLAGGTGDDTPLAGVSDLLGDGVSDAIGALPGSGDAGESSDLLADAHIDLLGSDLGDIHEGVLLDLVEPVTGDIGLDTSGTDLDLLGGSDNSPEDTDLALGTDLNIPGADLPDIDFADINLDPLESLTGDIDLNINAAIDLLNQNTGNGADLAAGNAAGDQITAWPENVLPDAGNIISDAGSTLGNILPDPVGSVTEGLGSLLGNDHQSGGGHHLGGLFG